MKEQEVNINTLEEQISSLKNQIQVLKRERLLTLDFITHKEQKDEE